MSVSLGGQSASVSLGGSPATSVLAGGDHVLPTLTINTEGGAPVVSRDDYLDASYSFDLPNGSGESGTMRIRGRGNYTWGLEKKPYRLNFDDDYSPLGMTANAKNWALLANHDDPRKLATNLGLTVGSFMDGLTWTPQFRPVEVTLNGDYIGLYTLTDLVRLDDGRVPGDEAEGTEGDSLTGTWLAEISRRYISEGDPGFTTTRDVWIQYDSPGVALDSEDAGEVVLAEYFRDWIQTFEDALYSLDFLDPDTGYAQYIDRESFADWYLVNEFASNQDSYFESSCKLWKEPDSAGGRLHMGPLWDMGISFGNQVNVNHAPDVWNTINATGPGATWIKRMISDPTFKALLQARWAVLKARIPYLLKVVDQNARKQAPAMLRDEDRWDESHVDPETAASYVKGWILAREAWMDGVLPSITGAPGDD